MVILSDFDLENVCGGVGEEHNVKKDVYVRIYQDSGLLNKLFLFFSGAVTCALYFFFIEQKK